MIIIAIASAAVAGVVIGTLFMVGSPLLPNGAVWLAGPDYT